MCRLLHRAGAANKGDGGTKNCERRMPCNIYVFAVIKRRALSHSARAFNAPLGATSRFFVRSLCWLHSAVNSKRAAHEWKQINTRAQQRTGQCAGALGPKGLAQGTRCVQPHRHSSRARARLTEHNSINSHVDGGRIAKHFQFDGPWQWMGARTEQKCCRLLAAEQGERWARTRPLLYQ